MRRHLMLVSILAVSLFVGVSSAQAVVVEDEGSHFGVALVPSAREGSSTTASYLANAGIPMVTSSAPCSDPAAGLEPDLLPLGSWPLTETIQPLCWHSGEVAHSNETFTVEWESSAPNDYWSGTQDFVQKYLKNVATASGSLSSPYAATTQYWDGMGAQYRAADTSLFGGGCDDTGTAQCRLGGVAGSGPGNPLPASDCPVSGNNYYAQAPGGSWTTAPNNLCLTDADIRHEVASMIDNNGLIAHTQPGYTPLVVVLTPPGVEVCVDSGESLCSANSDANPTDPVHVKAQFCSYHAQVVDPASGHPVTYVVQPWTAFTSCDEPDVPTVPSNPTPDQVSENAGERLVSPLSQAEMAAIVNPSLNGWFGLDGLEINDENGCRPLTNGLDQFTIGGGTYFIQREFNNAAVIDSDPTTYSGCLPGDLLTPAFVVPSAVDQGDVVDLDGASTRTSLLIPNAGYRWEFGDGATAVGPSVAHAYANGGTYSVTLTVTDRGGNVRSLTQTISVLGPNGQVVAPPPAAGGSNGSNGTSPGLHVKLQLLPESLKALLRRGIALKVTTNEAADGIASVSIAHREAKRAHVAVVIGRGTVKGLIAGTVELRLRLPRKVAAKIRRLRRVTLTIRLMLIDRSGDRQTVVVAGRY